MMDVKISKYKHITTRVDQIDWLMLDEIESKTLQKDQEGDW